jgi:phage-related protein
MAVDVTMRLRAEDQASGVLSRVGGAFSNVLQGAASFIAANVIQRGGEAILKFATDSFQGALDAQAGIDALRSSIDRLGESSPLVMDEAKRLAEQFKNLVGGSDDMVLAMTNVGLRFDKISKDMFPDFIQKSSDLATVLKMEPTRAAELLGKVLQDLGTDGVGSVGRLKLAGVQFTDEQEKQIKTLVESGDVLGAQRVLMDALAKSTDGAAAAAANTAKGQWTIFKETIADAGEGVALSLLPSLTKFASYLNTNIAPAITGFIDSFKTAFDFLSDAFEGGFDISKLFTISEGGKTLMGDMLKSVGIDEGLADTIGQTFAGAFSWVDGVGRSVRDFFDFLGNWWTLNGAPLVENFKSMGASTAEVFGRIVADIKPLIDEVLAKVAAWMLENGPLIQEFFRQVALVWNDFLMPVIGIAWETIKPIIGGLIDLMLGLGKIIMQVVTGDWQGAWETLKETASSVGEALIDAVTNLMNGILELFGTNLNEVTDVMADWINDAIAWGSNLVEGIRTGISNAWSGLRSWFQSLWQDLVGGVKDFLGMQSPSKVFAGIGANMMAGLAEGIGGGATVPVNAMLNATSGIVNAVPVGAAGSPVLSASAASAPTIIVNVQSPVTVMDEKNAVENLRKYVGQAFRQLKSEGVV